MSKESIPQKRPHRAKTLPFSHDPGRRLLAAIVLQSVADYLYPECQTPQYARRTAADFLHSAEGRDWLKEFGISTWNISSKLGRPS